MANGGIQPRMFFRKSDNEKSDLISMLYQFKGDFEKEYLSSIIPKIDITDAIEKGEKYGNFKLSEKAKKKYEKFFGTPMKELKDFYEQYYEEPEK